MLFIFIKTFCSIPKFFAIEHLIKYWNYLLIFSIFDIATFNRGPNPPPTTVRTVLLKPRYWNYNTILPENFFVKIIKIWRHKSVQILRNENIKCKKLYLRCFWWNNFSISVCTVEQQLARAPPRSNVQISMQINELWNHPDWELLKTEHWTLGLSLSIIRRESPVQVDLQQHLRARQHPGTMWTWPRCFHNHGEGPY